MSDGMIKYLAYGSNMHPLRLHERVTSSEIIDTVSIRGFQLRFHKIGADDSAKCNMYHTGNDADRVHGVIYRMRADQRIFLDRAEGLGRGYELARFELEAGGYQHQVFCYIADSRYIDDGLQPFDWYKQLVLSAARYHGFPRPYVQRIDRVVARPDPDAARSEFHYRIVDAL